MDLFDAFDSTMAEILGENEYELLSKSAKVSETNQIDLIDAHNDWSMLLHQATFQCKLLLDACFKTILITATYFGKESIKIMHHCLSYEKV